MTDHPEHGHTVLQIMPADDWYGIFQMSETETELLPLISWALIECEYSNTRDVVGLVFIPGQGVVCAPEVNGFETYERISTAEFLSTPDKPEEVFSN